ncbi:mucin-2-like isoform X1 [Diorhabda carinulata]|uniref:mucin-2-like isoform X1 n=1 Tax=Diorhabda carinulata TaxID=1163345 RepID=UPI0025A28F8C|nr:mucin-2-like isoform X1 [Diorhabda carinulata]
MQGSTKIPITDLNAYITCKICSGYFVDASTIIECLHTFCRSCIIKYFQKNKYCPVCDVQVHKSKPLLNIRPDKTVQDIVYKLVPRLFQNEMQRRREFYDNHPEAKPSSLEQCGVVAYQHLLTPEETICLTLSYHGADNKPRYLRCPAAVTMGHIKKLIRAKYDLTESHRVDVFYNQDCLSSSLTLMDVAYIYLWKRKGPIELTYRIYENTAKKIKLEVPHHNETTGTNVANNNNNNNNNISNNNNWKEVQLRISENGEMSITGIQDAALSPSLLEIVNSEPKYKSDVTTLVETQPVNKQTTSKKEVPGLKYIGKVTTTCTSLLNNIAVSSHTISLGNVTNTYTSVSLPAFVDPIISTPITSVTLSTKSDFLTVSLPSSSISCATLSSGGTTMVFSTINTSKCSTKTEDSILKAAQPDITEINSERDTEKPLKRKLEPNVDVEPPAKQSKPIILNHNIGLLNLSNNHPLKKHSKLNRNGENLKDLQKVTCVSEIKITNVVTTSTVTILNSTSLHKFNPVKKLESEPTKPNIINKSISNIQRPGTPTSTTKPLAMRAKTLISETGVKPPCYQPRTVYGSSINVPKTLTSTTTLSIVSGSVDIPTTADVKSTPKVSVSQKVEKSVAVTSVQHSQSNQNNNKIPMTTQPSQLIQNALNKDSTANQQSTIGTNKIQNITGIRPIYSDSGKCTVLSVHTFPPPQTTQGINVKTTSSTQLQTSQVVTSITNAVGKTTIAVTTSPPQITSNKVSNIKTKPSTPIGYKTLRDPPKSWNSQISKANISKSSPDPKFSDLKNVRPAKFFKMRNNLPRYLGNPASGVKPMYQVQASPEKDKTTESVKTDKSEIKKHSIVKIDPKTLKPVSEKAPETTSLSNQSITNQNLNSHMSGQLYQTQCLNSNLNIPNSPGINLQNDLKINTSSVSIFNPLKLQSSPKNERRSPKSPHSPKMKSSNSPTGNKRDKVNLNFTPPNPFVPNIPSKTLSPTQFIYPNMPPGFTPYDPRVMAAYYSQWYGQRIAFPPAALPGLNLDLNQRKGLDILTSPSSPKIDPLTQSMLNHQMPIRPPPLASTSTTPLPRSHNTSLSSPTITKPPSVSKKSWKESKNDKSLETVVEKMTQNLNKLTGQIHQDASSQRAKEVEVKKTEMEKNSPRIEEKVEKENSDGNSDNLVKIVDQKRELNKINNGNDKVDNGTNRLSNVAESDTDVNVPVSDNSNNKEETKVEKPLTSTPQPPIILNATVATVLDTSDNSISTKESNDKEDTVKEITDEKSEVKTKQETKINDDVSDMIKDSRQTELKEKE